MLLFTVMWLFCGAFGCSCLAWHSRVLHHCKSSECSTEMPCLETLRLDFSVWPVLPQAHQTCSRIPVARQDLKSNVWTRLCHDIELVPWNLWPDSLLFVKGADSHERLSQDVYSVGSILEGCHCTGKYAMTISDPRVFQEHVCTFHRWNFQIFDDFICCSSLPQPEGLIKSQKTAAFLGCMLAPWAGCFFCIMQLFSRQALISKKVPILHRPPTYPYTACIQARVLPRLEWIVNLILTFKHHNTYKDDKTREQLHKGGNKTQAHGTKNRITHININYKYSFILQKTFI